MKADGGGGMSIFMLVLEDRVEVGDRGELESEDMVKVLSPAARGV